jgi:hypothetical protein
LLRHFLVCGQAASAPSASARLAGRIFFAFFLWGAAIQVHNPPINPLIWKKTLFMHVNAVTRAWTIKLAERGEAHGQGV